jgi:hypothetical protein
MRCLGHDWIVAAAAFLWVEVGLGCVGASGSAGGAGGFLP